MKNILIIFCLAWFGASVYGQVATNPSAALPINSTEQDHKNMLNQLGIIKLRPGASGNESAPNHANYDEVLANPCIELRDPLISKNGQKISTPDMWWKIRRPEIAEDIENEMYGKIPENIPQVTWKVKLSEREFVNRIPVQVKHLSGHVDNSSFPAINVDIQMILVTPINGKGPVPVLMMFGRPSLPAPAQPNLEELEKLNTSFINMWIKTDPSVKDIFDKYPAYQPITRIAPPNPFGPPKPEDELTPQDRLLAAGWGYCTIDVMIKVRKFIKFAEFYEQVKLLYQDRKSNETITDLYPKIIEWCSTMPSQ